jgi:putative hydrolase of the HAD superfamily
MVSVLMLDGDGVVITGKSFSERLARDLKVDPAKEKEFFSTTFQDCVLGKADLKQAVVPYLSSFGWQGTADEFLEYWFTKECELNTPLLENVARLRQTGVRVVMATNQEKYRATYLLDTMHVGDMVDTIYFSFDIGLKKPTDQYLDYILNDLQVDKSEVVFWDDEQKSVDSARQHGIHAERYTDYASFATIMAKKYGMA